MQMARALNHAHARAGGVAIAYQVVGEGPFDLLYIPGFVSNVELAWEEPRLARFLGGLASFSRLILFDKRGTGLSDRVALDEPEEGAGADGDAVQLRVAGGDRDRTRHDRRQRLVHLRRIPGLDANALRGVVRGVDVFARVAPVQKYEIVRALQAGGDVVAMTGDGVNDVLALKDADIGISMGSGAAATRAVAQLVLLDGRFATLPHVVAEGRRVIANVERVANLFLTKTVYSMTMATIVGTSSRISSSTGCSPTRITVLVAGTYTLAFTTASGPGAYRAVVKVKPAP